MISYFSASFVEIRIKQNFVFDSVPDVLVRFVSQGFVCLGNLCFIVALVVGSQGATQLLVVVEVLLQRPAQTTVGEGRGKHNQPIKVNCDSLSGTDHHDGKVQ